MRCWQVSDGDSEGLQQCLAIYRSSFPADERHADSLIVARLQSGFYRMLVAEDEHGVAIFALLHTLVGSGLVLLDYVALRENARGRGLGSAFLRELIGQTAANGERLLLEVEDPRYGANQEMRQRRLQFYRRLGCRELGAVPYKMPALAGGRPTAMLLLLAPAEGMPPLAGAWLRRVIRQIYAEVYHRDTNDELLLSILREIPESVALS